MTYRVRSKRRARTKRERAALRFMRGMRNPLFALWHEEMAAVERRLWQEWETYRFGGAE